MHRRVHYRRLAALIALWVALVVPAIAQASVRAQLRVEGPDRTLDPGTHYRTGTERVRRATRSDCQPKDSKATIQGPTALGIVQSGIEAGTPSSDRLRPLLVQTFPSTPGYFVCRIGDFASTPGYWLYKVNHVSPTIGADRYGLTRGDEVLWFYADFGANINTGDELGLNAPSAATAGEPFSVKVVGWDGDGNRSPVAGATVTGGDAPVTTAADGKAQVTVSDPGTARLKATDGSDIPSERERVTVS